MSGDEHALPNSGLVLYQTEDGQTRLECRFDGDTIWSTQALMAELFQTTPQNVTLHLKAIYAEGELTAAATCKDYLHVRQAEREAAGAEKVMRQLEQAAKALPKRKKDGETARGDA